MVWSTKPIKQLTYDELKELIKNSAITVVDHALDHLSSGQRKVFKKEELIHTITREKPRKIYLQENKRYAVYYRKKEGYRKIILEFETKHTFIISFMDVTELPKVEI